MPEGESVSHSVMSGSLPRYGLQPTRLLCTLNSPGNILEWVAVSFSGGSSRSRDRTLVSCLAGRFFTIWATREAHSDKHSNSIKEGKGITYSQSYCTSFHFWVLSSFRVHVEKAMAPHSSTLAWKIPWMEKPGRLQSMGSQKVRHDWATSLSLFTFMHWRRKWQPTPVFLLGESQDRGALWAAVYGVAQNRTRPSDFTFSFHFHALEKEMAAHSSVLAWRIPGTGSLVGCHLWGRRVGHNWSDLAAAAAAEFMYSCILLFIGVII